MFSAHNRSSSFSSDDSHPWDSDKPVPPPVLVYHESARSIVFRDHLRRAQLQHAKSTDSSIGGDDETFQVVNYTPTIKPLPPLELTAKDEFTPLLQDIVLADLTDSERDVLDMFKEQRACVKTLRNSDWTAFLRRFLTPATQISYRSPHVHEDIAPHGSYPFNSFVTSTTLLPENGKKMRAFGSTNEYTTGVVFALPTDYVDGDTETQAVERTKTWAWPSGYAAKTEFNIGSKGDLINGRQEALVSLETLRNNNNDYLTKEDYAIMGRMIKGGLQAVPYNEVFLRVGGVGGRIVNGKDTTSVSVANSAPSFEFGVGLPVAFFVRTATYGHLISLLRTRARVAHVLKQDAMKSIPLLLITPELGTRVLTTKMEQQLLQIAARDLNPFQNSAIAYKTTVDNTSDLELTQKMEELLDLESDNIRQVLTPEERAHLAGGFGATDESTVKLLMEAKRKDDDMENGEASKQTLKDDHPHHLQDLVNEGLASAVRSSDYHTARQLLILYSLVATQGYELENAMAGDAAGESNRERASSPVEANVHFSEDVVKRTACGQIVHHNIPSPPPPPPLDTDRLRSATNSDGLLAVLGAAQVLKAMQDGGAKKRVKECIGAIEEWVEHGQNSVAFRLASWHDQQAAQADLKIAMENDSSFMAFVSNKAVVNRKAFAAKLKAAAFEADFQSVKFLQAIHEMVSNMHSPCLRLELLQFVLGLDNRFSVAHLARSVELAATCLSITATPVAAPRQLEDGS